MEEQPVRPLVGAENEKVSLQKLGTQSARSPIGTEKEKGALDEDGTEAQSNSESRVYL